MTTRLLSPTLQILSVIALSAGMLSTGLSAADVTNTPSVGSGKPDEVRPPTLNSWELPSLTVQGKAPSTVRDDQYVGDYGQPRWSTARRWSEVRSYVIPEGQVEFEYWFVMSSPSRNEKKADPDAVSQIKQLYEVEMGLGYRFQLDLYQVWAKEGNKGDNKLDKTKFELRYALADWDVLWGNPTLYGEWGQAASGPDSAEFKLLLSDDLASRWAWATNFVWEQQTGAERELALEWNSAIGYSAIDEKLSIGVELAMAQVSKLDDAVGGGFTGHRSHVYEVSAGPSIRFHPTAHAHIILTEFFGLNNDAHENRTTLIAGWEF